MKTHELKTDPEPFEMSWRGVKPYEIRKNDRGIMQGDILILRETKYTGAQMRSIMRAPLVYTGRTITAKVLSVFSGYGVTSGWAIIAIADVEMTQ